MIDTPISELSAELIWREATGLEPSTSERARAGAALLRAMQVGRGVPRGARNDQPLWAYREDLL